MKNLLQRVTLPLIIALIPLLARMEAVELRNPLSASGGALSPFELFGRIVGGLIFVLGSLALLFFIYGGFRWLTSAGNEESIKKGKATLVWATLGLAVVIGSYTILSYIIAVLVDTAPGRQAL